MMLQKVLKGDYGKYVSDESVYRCWRKADILHVTWNSDIHNNVVSETLAHSKFFISHDICNEL